MLTSFNRKRRLTPPALDITTADVIRPRRQTRKRHQTPPRSGIFRHNVDVDVSRQTRTQRRPLLSRVII